MAARVSLGGQGALLVIGGAEDKLGNKAILRRFVSMAGGPDARIAVLSTASSLGDEATEIYRALFSQLGVHDVRGLRPITRGDADAIACVEAMADVTGLFMTGGNQSKLTQVVSGTRLGDAILNAHDRGAIIAGTSAGASALSTHMVAFGAEGETPKQRMVHLANGLGLLPGVIVDQHFSERNRLGRLLALVAASPGLLGMGIDEDTAALVSSDATLEVLGKGAVLIVDGRHIESNAYDARRSQALMVSGAIVHTLPAGYRFDLHERQLMPSQLALVAEPDVAPRVGRRAARRVAVEGVGPRVARRRTGRDD